MVSGGAERAERAIYSGGRAGSYQIDAVLGRGGMGCVFSAHHVDTGRIVALKTISKVESVSLECLQQEVSTLAQLEHPGVVPIYDFGSERGEPWYAMELLRGPTLRDLLQSGAGDGAASSGIRAARTLQRAPALLDGGLLEALGQSDVDRRAALLDVCSGLLETLCYIHGRGLVHGDIKPENVFVGGRELPILVDFGIALSFDRSQERLTVSPRAIGSAAYMAPERIRGQSADARADLYALGCILYECLTGIQAFARDTVEGTLLAHLKATPAPVHELCPSIPPPLGKLVDRLLAKVPASRPGYAEDVLEALSRYGSPQSQRTIKAPANYLYRADLVGRSHECQQLFERVETMCSGQACRLALRGARGIGKTRLLLEFVEMAEAAEISTFKAAPDPGHQNLVRPYSSMLPLLRRLHQSFLERPDTANAESKRVVERALALASGEEVTPDIGDDSVLTRAFIEFCVSTPSVLAVDDPQFCDPLSREFLQRMTHAAGADVPILFVLAVPMSEAIPPGFEEVTVPPLDEAGVQEAIESSLAIEMAPRQLVKHAYEASGGNPLVLGQYLRSLVDAKVLQRSRRSGWYVDWNREHELGELGRASGADVWFQRATRQLSSIERHVAQAAALLGERFKFAVLSDVLPYSRDEVVGALASLRGLDLLHLEPTGYYRFCNRHVRELLVTELDAEQSRRLREAVIAILTQSTERDAEQEFGLATHWRCVGDHGKASQCYELAANQLRLANRHWEVFHALQCAAEELALCPPAVRSADASRRVHEDLGDAALVVRRLEEAGEAYDEALRDCGSDPVLQARLHRKLAAARERDSHEALSHLQQAMTILENTPEDLRRMSEWIQSRLDAMFVHYWKQQTSELLAIARAIEVEIDRFGTPTQVAEFHFNLAAGYMQQQRYIAGARELGHVERALRLYQEARDGPRVAMCRFLRSMLLLCSGRLDEAEDGFNQLLSFGKSAASVTIQIRALTYLCLVHRKRGTQDRLRKLAAAALSMATEHSMQEYRGTALANLAWLSLLDGEILECKRLAAEAREAWTASKIRYSFYWTASLPLLAAQLEADDWEVSDFVTLADELLHVTQELLPSQLTAELEELRAAGPSSRHEAREVALRVLQEARRLRLL